MVLICFSFRYICGIVQAGKTLMCIENEPKETFPPREKSGFCVLPISNSGRWNSFLPKRKPIYPQCLCLNNWNCSDRNKKMLDSNKRTKHFLHFFFVVYIL